MATVRQRERLIAIGLFDGTVRLCPIPTCGDCWGTSVRNTPTKTPLLACPASAALCQAGVFRQDATRPPCVPQAAAPSRNQTAHHTGIPMKPTGISAHRGNNIVIEGPWDGLIGPCTCIL
jgi:hypothetical protein